MSLKILNKKIIHDYESIMKGIKRTIQIEFSENNAELIERYERWVSQSMATQ